MLLRGLTGFALLLTFLLTSLVPGLASAAAACWSGGTPAGVRANAPTPSGAPVELEQDGGACGEDEELEELIDCGSDLEARLDEPYAITVLRKTEVRTTQAQCEDLLADIWARQTCSASSRECGKLLPGATPGPGPKLAGSSASGHAHTLVTGIADADARRLGAWPESRMPKPRDLLPPVPPPKLAAR